MKMCNTNIILLSIGAILLCLGISIIDANAEERPNIARIVIEGEKHDISVGNDRADYYAMVMTADGEVVRNSEYSKVKWYIQSSVKKERLNIRVNETNRLVTDKNSKYYGCYCVTLSAPYGTPTNAYRLFAENVKMPIFDQEKEFFFLTDYNDEHFLSAQKGSVEYGLITGNNPVVYEKYDYDKDAYLIILPKNNYKSKNNVFIGWKYGKNTYQPGQRIYVNVNSNDRKIVAQWKPKFQKTEVQVTKGKKKLKINWNVVAGANEGYKVYRSTKRKGKYKLIENYWYYVWNYFEDKSVKRGKTYWYKVKAIKKNKKGKKIIKTSDPVKMSLKYSNVRRIKLNRKKVTGKAGAMVKMKAKVKRKHKKKYAAEKVTWYTSDSSIAKIGKRTGKIRLLKPGRCTIYCRSFNGQKSKEISVIVLEKYT